VLLDLHTEVGKQFHKKGGWIWKLFV